MSALIKAADWHSLSKCECVCVCVFVPVCVCAWVKPCVRQYESSG